MAKNVFQLPPLQVLLFSDYISVGFVSVYISEECMALHLTHLLLYILGMLADYSTLFFRPM